MTIVNRARLRNVLVQGGIARESAAVDAVDAFVEEFESARGDFVTRADLDGAVAEIKQYVAETAVRIIGVTLGGTAIATAILGIVIAVT